MNKMTTLNIGIVLLAAGSSSRLGKPKQLLQYNNQSLFRHSLNAALHSETEFILVVLGANADLLRKEMDTEKAYLISNVNWKEGMASSIICGMNALTKIAPAIEAVIIMVCDQPHITPLLLNDIIRTHQETGKKIVASTYEGITGPPVLFHKDIFSELMQLKGDFGARAIVQQFPDEVATVLFEKGNIDIDTREDYEMLLNEIIEK